LRRDEDDAIRKALIFKVEGQKKTGKTWRKQVEEVRGIRLQKADAHNRASWRHGVELIMTERR